MGNVKSWVMGVEDDAWSMEKEDFLKKHGLCFEEMYNEISRAREEEFELVNIHHSLHRFLEGEGKCE